MDLKLRHLATFHAVMEEGSVSKAADRLGLSQPAVSIALTRLEEMLGYPLFHRSKGYFVPRPEAQKLLEDAEIAILAFERFGANAKLIGSGDRGLVRIGSIGSAANNFIPEVSAAFFGDRTDVELDVQVRSSAQIAHLVGNGQLDIGIVEAPVAAHSVRAINFRLPCLCIMRQDDTLANLDFVTPADMAQRRIISVSQNHILDRHLRRAFEDAGLVWRSDLRAYFFNIMRRMVDKGLGVSIVDSLNARADIKDMVTFRPFKPDLTYELAVITRTDSELPPSTRLYLESILTALEKYAV